jgi:hypothetical protein
MKRPPYIDEHARNIDALRERTWAALIEARACSV